MIDSRKSINEIAKSAGISGAAVHQRLKKLEKANITAGSHLVINHKTLGYKTIAFIGIYLDKANKNPEAVKQLEKIPKSSNVTIQLETGVYLSKLFVRITSI